MRDVVSENIDNEYVSSVLSGTTTGVVAGAVNLP